MKFEENLKDKFLYSKKFNLFKFVYFYYQLLKTTVLQRRRKIYSNWGLDIMADHFFKNKEKGIYIDVGCHHPFLNNNTYRLYKRGWNGINIDLDFNSIEMFNYFRKFDLNIQAAISDEEVESDLFFFHNRSAVNTLSKDTGYKAKKIIKVDTKILNNIIENSKYKDEEIDFLSIDVEGFELNVIKGFNLKKYKPKLIILEFIDQRIKEFYLGEINNVLNSKIYKYMIENDYKLVNWIHDDLIFVPKNIAN
jgi:FkbM family methyltransferase